MTLPDEHIALINRAIDGVVEALQMDADSMSLDPRHCGKTENVVAHQESILNWIDRDRNDIIYRTFNVDLGDGNTNDKNRLLSREKLLSGIAWIAKGIVGRCGDVYPVDALADWQLAQLLMDGVDIDGIATKLDIRKG
jgi:hypothetical protein